LLITAAEPHSSPFNFKSRNEIETSLLGQEMNVKCVKVLLAYDADPSVVLEYDSIWGFVSVSVFTNELDGCSLVRSSSNSPETGTM
jgi:hypothetical protein